MNHPINAGKAAIAICSLFLIGPASRPVSQAPASEITFCGDLVPSDLRQANASFQVFYELETDPSGKTARVTKLKNDVLPDGPLVACLQKWRLPATNAKVRVSLRWEHAKGWTEFSISIPGHPSRQITIQPGWPF